MDEVAHFDLSCVVDNVLIVLQLIPVVRPAEHTKVPEDLLACSLRIGCVCSFLSLLWDIWVRYRFANGNAVALWSVDKLLEVWTSSTHALDRVVLSSKSGSCHIFLPVQFKLIAECNFAEYEKVRLVANRVLETLGDQICEIDAFAEHVAS